MEHKMWVSGWEKLVQRFGLGRFVLVHDGQRNPGQFELPPEDVRFYTKIYRWEIDGKFINTWVKFKYDLRDNEVGMDLTFHDPLKPKGSKRQKESLVMWNPKEVFHEFQEVSGETSTVGGRQDGREEVR
jgi:hypothetical protein